MALNPVAQIAAGYCETVGSADLIGAAQNWQCQCIADTKSSHSARRVRFGASRGIVLLWEIIFGAVFGKKH
jgi:hypothetical protein